MSVVGVNSVNQTYVPSYESTSTSKETEKTQNTAALTGAVYEKSSSDSSKKATYANNKMSAEKRAEIVKQMKADQEQRQSKLMDIVNSMITDQAKKFTQADDNFWKTLASGKFTVDAKTKQEAQEAISEDGYYGVEKTAQRIFDFASALAGDDVDKMKDMQAAFEKGFKQATKSWGKDLPSISGQTKDRVNEMFDQYYSSKNTITE